METTFWNVNVTICARTSKLAYTKLCNALATIDPDVVWNTDTYTTDELGGTAEKSTKELFPKLK